MSYPANLETSARSDATLLPAVGVADAIVMQLHAWGVRSVWGVTGDAVLHLVDAITRHGGIRYIDMRHEEAAALAASAYAKCTGRLGVCLATAGPGVAHLINGLADAGADHVPVLALTGQVERKYIGTTHKQYIDQQRLLAGVCALSAPVVHPAAAMAVLTRAMRTAIATRMPVHVEVAKDIWPLVAPQTIHPPEPYLSTSAASPAYVVQQAADIVAQAERPLIYIGRGARGAIAEIMELAERIKAPVVRTMAAAGFTPGFHPLSVGGAGEGGSEAAGILTAEADCILRIGATWWPGEWLPGRARVVAVDVLPQNVGAGIEPTFGVVGDARTVLQQMLTALWPTSRPVWQAHIDDVRNAWNTRIEHEVQAETTGIAPARLMRTLETVVPEDAIICVDVGEHTLWFNRVFRGRGQEVLVSGTWRTMGFGLPAAAAAKAAYAHKPVVALVGDGGLGMVLAEFTSLVKHGLPVAVVVVNNRSLAFEQHRMETAHLQPVGASLHNPDFAAVARLCGGAGYRITRPEDLEGALRESMWLGLPALVDVVTADVAIPTVRGQS